MVGGGIAQLVQCLGYGPDDRGSIPGRDRDLFLFATASRLALGLIQPPIPMATRVCFLGSKLHLVPRSRISGAIPPFSHMPSWYLVKHKDNFTFIEHGIFQILM
jgi:hypothetical protein